VGRDFFISYTGVNRAWAEWIAVELERAGFTTVVQAFDFGPASDWAHEMQKATATTARTIAVLSPAYFGSAFGEAEWRAAFAKDPTGELGLLIPVRVQPCEPPGLLASRVYVDLVGADETVARRKLLAAVETNRARPTEAAYPGETPRFPGLGPRISDPTIGTSARSAPSWTLCRRPSEELQPVAVRIVDIKAPIPRQLITPRALVAGSRKPSRQLIKIGPQQARMRLPRRYEGSFDAQMQLNPVPPEPATTAGREG